MTEKTPISYKPFTSFNLFKWAIYFLLMFNVYLFFLENQAASSVLFPEGLNIANVIVGFADSIDTGAWVFLILLFELETYVLPDDWIVGRTKIFMHYFRIVLYVIIIYSFYGYVLAYIGLSGLIIEEPMSLCAQVDGVSTFMTTLNEYALLTTDNCASISQSSQLYAHSTEAVFADANTLSEARGLGVVDIINAGTWLLICLILEVDVRLEIKDMLEGNKLILSNLSKVVLYTILTICAVYWGVSDKFIDFWDAFLWILAFVAIEFNMFKWHQEEDSLVGSISE